MEFVYVIELEGKIEDLSIDWIPGIEIETARFKGVDESQLGVIIDKSIVEERGRYTVTRRSRGVAEGIANSDGEAIWCAKDLQEGIPVVVTRERKFELVEIESAP